MQGCREPEILEKLGREVRIYARAIPKRLAALLAAKIVENVGDVVCIYTEDERLGETIWELLEARGLGGKAVLVRDPSACRDMPTILVSSRKRPPDNLDYLMLVAPEAKASRVGLTRLQVLPLEGGVYRVRIGSHVILLREEGGRLCEPTDLLVYRVAELAKRMVREYGPLPMRDAVQLLAQELGVSRSEARRLLYEAIQAGLVRVEAGSITL